MYIFYITKTSIFNSMQLFGWNLKKQGVLTFSQTVWFLVSEFYFML